MLRLWYAMGTLKVGLNDFFALWNDCNSLWVREWNVVVWKTMPPKGAVLPVKVALLQDVCDSWDRLWVSLLKLYKVWQSVDLLLPLSQEVGLSAPAPQQRIGCYAPNYDENELNLWNYKKPHQLNGFFVRVTVVIMISHSLINYVYS